MELVDMIRPNSGCALAKGSGFTVFQGLFKLTNGKPCWGCAYNIPNECEFLRKQLDAAHTRRRWNFNQHSHETNAEIAKRMGMSKRQVAKMRKKGELS
ncbi:hypothetical protein LCGC14_1251160 [marine sediment metagenome]|uniref:Uncharacterized protein n=1 Tax=marine sediment metagenome TaxID=412755 RepID=A0A0F9L6J8_9ZZZZ